MQDRFYKIYDASSSLTPGLHSARSDSNPAFCLRASAYGGANDGTLGATNVLHVGLFSLGLSL